MAPAHEGAIHATKKAEYTKSAGLYARRIERGLFMDGIEIISAEEKLAAAEKFQALQRKALEMTQEERLGLCDMGFYNQTIEGYLVEALRVAGFTRADIERATRSLHTVLDDTSAAEAAEICRKF